MAVTRGSKRKVAEAVFSVNSPDPATSVGRSWDEEVIDLTSDDEEWTETVEKSTRRGQKKRRTRVVKPKLSQKQVKEEKQGVQELDKQEGEACGICLSDEVKEQGKLDCCDHFFCFQCIMEWGKVESKCPMCKQRFSTIVRPAICGIPRSRKKTVRVPERNQVRLQLLADTLSYVCMRFCLTHDGEELIRCVCQVYEPTADEVMAMMAPQTDILCQYCSNVVDEGEQHVCSICETAVAHTHCAAPDGTFSHWICRYCSHAEVEQTFLSLDLVSAMHMANFLEQPRRSRRQERPVFSPSFRAPRPSRRAGQALGPTSGAASITRHSLNGNTLLFGAFSASLAEPTVSIPASPASVVSATRHRPRGTLRTSGVRASAGSSARRPILIPEDDDEVRSVPSSISDTDISRAWNLADRARLQLDVVVEVATNDRVRPTRNAGPVAARLPGRNAGPMSARLPAPSLPGAGDPAPQSSRTLPVAPIDLRSGTASAAMFQGPGCPPITQGRRGLGMRRVPPASSFLHSSSTRTGETMSVMRNFGIGVMDSSEHLRSQQSSHARVHAASNEPEVCFGPSDTLADNSQSSSRIGELSDTLADRDKKKQVMVVDLEEPSGRGSDTDVGLPRSWYGLSQCPDSLSMVDTPSPQSRQHTSGELKNRIRGLVKVELDPYFQSKQIGESRPNFAASL